LVANHDLDLHQTGSGVKDSWLLRRRILRR
jgi:hypothetical protein